MSVHMDSVRVAFLRICLPARNWIPPAVISLMLEPSAICIDGPSTALSIDMVDMFVDHNSNFRIPVLHNNINNDAFMPWGLEHV